MKRVIMLAGIGLLIAGCASSNVNPPQARARTGYVDLYEDSPDELIWEVARSKDQSQSWKTLFSEFASPKGGVVRLAFAPGQYRLRVTFIDRVITEPGQVDVVVKEGMVTPVRVELVESGTTSVEVRKVNVGGTIYGRYGRSTKVRSQESATYRVTATAQPPLPYQLKERMPYSLNSTN